MRKDALTRLLGRVQKNAETGCWEWAGKRMKKGYGSFFLLGRERLAHRAAYRLMVGDIPDGMMVCHHCDNPPCCNPDHLFLGTAKDNIQDSVRKGRFRPGNGPGGDARGEYNCHSKLSDAQVAEIRAMRGSGKSQTLIAKLFGVCQQHVSDIWKGETRTSPTPKPAQLSAA